MINFYDKLKPEEEKYANPNGKRYNIYHPFRILIVGSSGSGKTNVLLNLIHNLCCFEKYYLYVKLAGDDPLYDEILFSELQRASTTVCADLIGAYSDDIESLPDVKSDQIDSSKQNFFVFDDMNEESTRNLKRIEEYFTKARKRNCSLVYLAQDYFSTPLKIRRNCTHLIFTKINSDNDLRNIWGDVAKQDFETFNQFKRMVERMQPFIVYKRESGIENRYGRFEPKT